MSNTHENIEQSESKRVVKNLVRLKWIMALSVGLVTAIAGCLAGIYSLQQPYSWVCTGQKFTIFPRMWTLTKKLNEYKEQHETYPLTLEEMTSEWTKDDGTPLSKEDVDSWIVDGWRNPMIYSSDGKTWKLLSYGADGKPGGVGLNADFSCTDTDMYEISRVNLHLLLKDAKPTIEQVIYSGHFKKTAVFSVLAGIVSFLLALSLHAVKKPYQVIIGSLGCMFVAAFFVTGLVAALSIANGH